MARSSWSTAQGRAGPAPRAGAIHELGARRFTTTRRVTTAPLGARGTVAAATAARAVVHSQPEGVLLARDQHGPPHSRAATTSTTACRSRKLAQCTTANRRMSQYGSGRKLTK